MFTSLETIAEIFKIKLVSIDLKFRKIYSRLPPTQTPTNTNIYYFDNKSAL